jgi:UDP-N-acetylmuramate dehydrogenase
VLRLGGNFSDIQLIWPSGHPVIRAGAAALDVHVAHAACEAGIAGLEFLCGIPGTIGGAVAMNAGAYGREINDILLEAEVVDTEGTLHRMSVKELGFAYRHSALPEGWVVTSALLRGEPGNPAEIAERMQKIRSEREETQPVKSRTGGSTFKNPAGGRKAWQLIDAAGCRGLVVGDAQVSEKHCNFLINRGAATADDLESLGEEARARVHAHSGITLEWEIKRVGER